MTLKYVLGILIALAFAVPASAACYPDGQHPAYIVSTSPYQEIVYSRQFAMAMAAAFELDITAADHTIAAAELGEGEAVIFLVSVLDNQGCVIGTGRMSAYEWMVVVAATIGRQAPDEPTKPTVNRGGTT